MALVVDNDPFSSSANSYVSLAEMLTYVTERVPDAAVLTAWNALSTPQKSMYVVNATRSIDSISEWIGSKYSRDQKLDWPRYDAWVDGYMLDVTIVPDAVKEATYEMAIWSMQNAGLVAVSQNYGFDSIKVGPINIDFNESAGGSKDQYFPDVVAMILEDLASVSNPQVPGSRTIKMAKLFRT